MSAARLPLVLVLATAVVLAVALVWQARRSDDVAFLPGGGEGEWIMAPYPLQTTAIRALPAPDMRFQRRFEAPRDGGSWMLHVRARGEVGVRVNGVELELPAARAWREPRAVAVGHAVRAGDNGLAITVRNEHGPALLQAWLAGPGGRVGTDATWRVTIDPDGPRSIAAVPADDTRANPDGATLASPLASLRAKALPLALVFGLALAASVAGRRLFANGTAAVERAPRLALGVVGLAWCVLFVASFWRLPLELGFDYTGHLAYLAALDGGDWLPRAGDSWSSYHPPLYYWTAWLVRAIGSPLLGAKALKLATFGAALAHVFVAARLARRLFPERPARVAVAALVAGFLPVNLYMAAYASNEPLSGALIGALVLAVVTVVLAPSPGSRRWLAVGVLLGLALLTKFTALALVPWLLGFAWLALARDEHGSWRRASAWAAGVLAVALVIAGWYYGRNVAVFGRPVVFNWSVERAEGGWWQLPGFHTARYYTDFGAALTQPFFASFEGFWDGLYTTLFGDGLLAGKARVDARHGGWDYEWMAATYALALPLALLVLVGLGGLLVSAARDDDPRRRLACALLVTLHVVFLASAISYSMQAPMFSTVKAGFALGLLGPFAVAAARGWGTVDGLLARSRLAPLRHALDAYGATLVVVVFLTYLG